VRNERRSNMLRRIGRIMLLAVGMVLAFSVYAGLLQSVDLDQGVHDVVVYGADPGDSLGIAQAATGDCTGDGVMDLLIGANHADGPAENRPEAGEAYVVFGPDFPSAVDVRGIEGSLPDILLFGQDGERRGASSPLLWWGFADSFGEVVATGDLNDDGFDDLIISAALADGPSNGRPDAGEVYVVFGRSLGAWDRLRPAAGEPIVIDVEGVAGARPDVVVLGADEADLLLGSCAGDVNGDGVDDLLLAAAGGDGPDERRRDAGEAYVLFGRPTGMWPETIDLAADAADVTFFGAEAGDHLRWAVGAASARADGSARGDMNGDGLTDLAVGASHADGVGNATAEAGEVYVWYGRTIWSETVDLAQEPANIRVAGGDAGGMLGFFSIAFADVDDDGIDDLLVGAAGADGPLGATSIPARLGAGEAYVVFGCPTATAATERLIDLAEVSPDVTIYGCDSGDGLGATICGGDLDADGVDDILLGVPYASGEGNRRSGAGEAHAFYGRPAWPSQIDLASGGSDLTVYGADPGDALASYLVSAGDTNGDGTDDFLIGAFKADGPRNARVDGCGEAYVLFGAR